MTTKDLGSGQVCLKNMVTFKLIEESEDRLVYWYYPEGHEDKKPGVIVVDRVREEVRITDVAEEDWERDIPPEEMNWWRQ